MRNIGGDAVSVKSIITGIENPHTFEPRVSDVKSLVEADVFIRVGLNLETWSERLAKNAGNPDLVRIVASRNCEIIDNNPHVWMDIDNARRMVAAILQGMSRADPSHSENYRQNASRYDKHLQKLDQKIKAALSPFSDRAVITSVPAFSYFLIHYGIKEAGTIISVPGKQPSGRHIRDIISLIRKKRIGLIFTVPQFSRRLPDMIARETGAAVVMLTQMTGTLPGTDTYSSMLLEDTGRIINAFSRGGHP
ncbi:MAG TPA: zinc ABC transporter substrate-binding protein [Nitrospirae bacterium]|nr:zinc ABC transporter substrate-binding protein [Nitrospirota bacterium]